jgi:hypothetical protein
LAAGEKGLDARHALDAVNCIEASLRSMIMLQKVASAVHKCLDSHRIAQFPCQNDWPAIASAVQEISEVDR